MTFLLPIASSLKQIQWPAGINDLNPFILVLVGGVIFFGVTALIGFYWAAKSGHFENFKGQAEEIFGEDEPVGTITDQFPKKKKSKIS